MAKSFTSTVRIESQLPEWAGVAFTVRRFTEGLRVRILTDLAASRERVRELFAEAGTLEDVAKANDDPAAQGKLRTLLESINLGVSGVDRGYVRVGLVAVEGIDIDGAPATTETLIESGPVDLYQEILAAVKKEAGITETERKNSESPTTSGEVAGGETSGTTAANASGSDSMLTVTAISISPQA